jgi:hypothetical protein
MLPPSILRILDQNHAQSKACVPTNSNAPDIELRDSSGLRGVELQIAATAELARPSTAAPPAFGATFGKAIHSGTA